MGVDCHRGWPITILDSYNGPRNNGTGNMPKRTLCSYYIKALKMYSLSTPPNLPTTSVVMSQLAMGHEA